MNATVKRCMTVNLCVGMWSGHRLDRQVTSELTREKGATEDAVRVNKHLISKEMFKDVTSASSAVRLHFYGATLPWRDNGDRLLPRAAFMKFIVEHERLAQEFRDAVDDFADRKYPTAREQAEFRMGEMFNPDDYPSTEEVRHKFYITLDVDQVSQALDFRLEDNEAAMQARITRAMGGLWSSLKERVERYADRLSTPDGIFRDTMVENLRALVKAIPDLNFANDLKLAKIADEIEELIAAYDAEDLRRDQDVRSAVAVDAARIVKQMEGFMRAFGGSA